MLLPENRHSLTVLEAPVLSADVTSAHPKSHAPHGTRIPTTTAKGTKGTDKLKVTENRLF